MFSKNCPFYLPFLVALAMAITPLQGRAQPVAFEVYPLGGGTAQVDFTKPPGKPLPVLFVHGHNFKSANDSDFNYMKNWVNILDDLPSFNDALVLNSHLGIEPYYIRFVDQSRSIEDDATAIGLAVKKILARHGASKTKPIKVVIVAYSKGTISSRLYLKGHADQVSEFIAIAPPNHGLSPGRRPSGSKKLTRTMGDLAVNTGDSRGRRRAAGPGQSEGQPRPRDAAGLPTVRRAGRSAQLVQEVPKCSTRIARSFSPPARPRPGGDAATWAGPIRAGRGLRPRRRRSRRPQLGSGEPASRAVRPRAQSRQRGFGSQLQEETSSSTSGARTSGWVASTGAPRPSPPRWRSASSGSRTSVRRCVSWAAS